MEERSNIEIDGMAIIAYYSTLLQALY